MFFKFKNAAFGAVCALASALPASAAVFDLLDVGSDTKLGSFEAPELGGAITSFSVTVNGITFDTLALDDMAPTYDPLDNDIAGADGTLGAVYNSSVFGACGVGECVFSFYPIYDFDTPIPGEWYTDNLALDTSIDFGYYEVVASAVPLPTALLLSLTGIAGLSLTRRRKTAG